ncbi:MAG: response regulator transcription factor [Actinomycetota bacterium]
MGTEKDQRMRALVVDDAPEFHELVGGPLKADGFDVETAEDGERAVALAKDFEPEVIVLDVGLPKIDGVEACRRIRTFSDAYIVMLTVRDEEVDKLIGLSVGADDYMTKPFSPRELIARIHAMLRRPQAQAGSTGARKFRDLTIDPEARECLVGSNAIELTRMEFDLLDTLSSRPKVVFSRALLLEKIWGENYVGDDHVVDVHIAELRKKLGDDSKTPRFIRTVRGVGYRMAESA